MKKYDEGPQLFSPGRLGEKGSCDFVLTARQAALYVSAPAGHSEIFMV